MHKYDSLRNAFGQMPVPDWVMLLEPDVDITRLPFNVILAKLPYMDGVALDDIRPDHVKGTVTANVIQIVVQGQC